MIFNLGHIHFDDYSEYGRLHEFSILRDDMYKKFYNFESNVRMHIKNLGAFSPLGDYDSSMRVFFKEYTDLKEDEFEREYFHIAWFFIGKIIERTYYPTEFIVDDDIMTIQLNDTKTVHHLIWLLEAFGYDVETGSTECVLKAIPGDVKRKTTKCPDISNCRLCRNSLVIANDIDKRPEEVNVGNVIYYNAHQYTVASINESGGYLNLLI